MKKYNKDLAIIIGSITAVMTFLILLMMWTDRNIEFALSYFKGAPVEVPFWISGLATIILNVIVMMFNVVCEIARFVI